MRSFIFQFLYRSRSLLAIYSVPHSPWSWTNSCPIQIRIFTLGFTSATSSSFHNQSSHLNFLLYHKDATTNTSFWQVESTGTTQVAKTLDSDFFHDYLSTKITVQSDRFTVSSFLARTPTLPSPRITQYAIEEPDPWSIGWQRYQNF